MDEATLRAAAAKIRAEMVCCDVYDQLARFFDEAEYRALRRSSNYHGICHYGEWAARLVETLIGPEANDPLRLPVMGHCDPGCHTGAHVAWCPNTVMTLGERHGSQ